MVPKIAIIVGTTRPQRFSEKPAHWLYGIAAQRSDLSAELLDLRDFPLPFYAEEQPLSAAPPKNELALRWADTLRGFDGFLFVTGEYNHGLPAVLKNALDYALADWSRKPAAFFGYGGAGAARSIEQLRSVCAALQMAPLAAAVHIQGPILRELTQGKDFADFPFIVKGAQQLFSQLVWWANALKAARAADLTAHD